MALNLCRVNGSHLTKVLDFGMQPLGNGFITEEQKLGEYFFRMEIGYSETSMMLQLLKQPLPEKMFHDHYAFYSSTSKYMANHFKSFAEDVISSVYLNKDDPFIIELGCNDGIMLKNFSQLGFRHLGIEPSINVAQEANKQGIQTVSKFFTEELARDIVDGQGQADVFLAANVMCHIPDILNVVRGISLLLKPTGVAIFEDPYLGDVVAKTSYDQIYDEHVFLFSGLSIQYLFGRYDMELIDVLPQKTHGGSMRYVIAHKNTYAINESVKNLIDAERFQGLDHLETFDLFRINVEKSKADLVKLLKALKAQGKKIAGYAATSKSTTVLNYCGIGADLVDYICDTTPIKQGKLSPGMHIPIVPHEIFKNEPPDYAILLAWNHAEEIMTKESDYVLNGGKWIIHVPEVKII